MSLAICDFEVATVQVTKFVQVEKIQKRPNLGDDQLYTTPTKRIRSKSGASRGWCTGVVRT